MIETYGVTHISLAVQDPARSLAFYQRVFGVKELSRNETSIVAQTPGSQDLLAFEKRATTTSPQGGVLHFGFRLKSTEGLDAVLLEVEEAGGTLLKRGEFSPGKPFAYLTDPDGYKVELFYEG